MWEWDSVVYHVYALGACGAPSRNDFAATPVPRLRAVVDRLDAIRELGGTALLLGPMWESTAHGYDTVDMFRVDRRLGTNDDLAELADEVHARGMRLILDTVFNHVGRDFWAFQDVVEKGRDSDYRDWFFIDFDGRSPDGDPFAYEGWAGHFDLVKLNVDNPGVREHLLSAMDFWFETFDIDGLRLDAADVIGRDFLAQVAARARDLRPDMWLIGEMVHGDYRELARPGLLDSTTNYEAYKGLWSSFADDNLHEIAWTLNREFGPEGVYRGLPLLNFADNHDVDRVAASIDNDADLYPLYGILFTMPGVPSIYYGSEVGDDAARSDTDDRMLRPAFWDVRVEEPDLAHTVTRLAQVRDKLPALRHGDYEQLHVASEQLSFARTADPARVIVALNAAATSQPVPIGEKGEFLDHLAGEVVHSEGSVEVSPGWLRILTRA